MEKQFIISESKLVGLLQYLETRPYKEVSQGIAMLSQLKEFEIPAQSEHPSSPDASLDLTLE